MKPQNRFKKRSDHPKGDEGRPPHRRPEGMKSSKKRNLRSVWAINPKGFKSAHFAVMPEALVEPIIKAGCPEKVCGKCHSPSKCHCEAKTTSGLVLDPFMGAGTVAVVAKRFGRNYIGFELNPEYCQMGINRVEKTPLDVKL